MRAIVVEETGGPDALQLREVPEPVPGPSDVLVDVEAIGLNFIDTYHRGGLYPMQTPFIPGLEGAGSIADVGKDVARFRVGDRVVWSSVIGTYAERHVVPADKAIAVPEGATTTQAAAVILQGLTAQYLATSTYPVSDADVCLIHAGAGGVGLLLTQMVKARGATAITTVGSEEKVKLSREAGADRVINYVEDDFESEVVSLYGERPLTVVFDGVGNATFEAGLRLLRPRGMMVTFGNASGPVEAVPPLELMRQGSLFMTRPTLFDYTRTREELEERANEVLEGVATGDLRVHIGAEYALADAAMAHRSMEARQTAGKVILTP
ncbi:MAG: quinone oxidoreductase [Acidimicrobiia bacterium]|nr:quinone oxidoreductase [Acidimicrobiia bacterium]